MKKISLFSILVSCIIVIAAISSIIYFQKPKDDINIETQVPLADDTNATAESVSSLVDS